MIIKKYIEFIKESSEDFNSLGEWIEDISDDDYVMNIVNRYLGDIDPDIELSNAINLLDDAEQSDIKSQVQDYLENGLVEVEPKILATTDIESLKEALEAMPDPVQQEISVAGKGVFSSFLKSLTALGRKESTPDYENCPKDFLIFYNYKDLNSNDVKSIFSRFKSLLRYSEVIDYGKNELDLYFGIKCDGQFEYGISYDTLKPIGQFKLSKSSIKWLIQLQSKSAQSIKKVLVNLSYNDILLLGKIKIDMKDFNPGYHEKRSFPTINDSVISFGYYGIGKWDNGKLDDGEYMDIKNNFTTWVISKKWGSKVLISVKPQSFWLNIHIKLK
jgi:hypothetical protein